MRPVGVNVSDGYGRFLDDASATGGGNAGCADGRVLVANCRNAFWQVFSVRPREKIEPLVRRKNDLIWGPRKVRGIPLGNTRSNQLGSMPAFLMLSKRICDGDRGR